MAVRTREEILEAIRTRVGEQTDDETISFLEDVSDTLTDLETKTNGDGEDWKTKYEENDKEWRSKYTERFFSTDPNPKPEQNPNPEPEKPKKFEDLFTVKEN
nr:MAG TPA: hypothetical protein [Caudoviricetes sp.]